MKRILVACAAVTASLALASPALAHVPVGSASQVCDEATGEITLSASFDNPGYETQVAATDSIAGDLGSQSTPASYALTVPGPDRAAGSVSFAWISGPHSGTLEAPYEAVSGCVKPPPPPPPPPPPDNPPPPHNGPPPHTHIGGPPVVEEGGPTPAPAEAPQPRRASAREALPFSGPPPIGLVGLAGSLLLAGGFGLRRLTQ